MTRTRRVVIACLFLALMATTVLLVLWAYFPRGSTSPASAKMEVGTDGPNDRVPELREEEVVQAGAKLWEIPGRKWRLKVKRYTSRLLQLGAAPPQPVDATPKVLAEFEVGVEVLPMRHRGERKIARFLLTSVADTPDPLAKQHGVLEIDMSTGAVEDLKMEDEARPYYYTFEGGKCLRTEIPLPVDWIVVIPDLFRNPQNKEEYTEDRTGRHEKMVKTLESTTIVASRTDAEKAEKAVRIGLVVQSWDHQQYKLVQTWVSGEPWWRSFQRWQQDSLELEADRIEDK